MPKIVDNYVLERKIGSGQFGEVYKGYNKQTQTDIAIKCVKRELLKGKFTELLENEIKVLRTCNNDNIIKLYDIKKTANNIYLILEYCNEGDLAQYLKQKKYLTEQEAVEFLIQILNGFKTLVKNKIMHRDFKLANILKHDGDIKIADFGFSKLLGNDNNANTMLGSPLNMAPEVLNNKVYDSKADIWSIGTCFYELLFGKPPFTASNMIDLLKNIEKNPVKIDRTKNSITPEAEDVIRRMLVVDPQKRITWEELFNHKINYYQEERIKKDLENTLKGGDVMLNMSKFYIKNNMVIDHPAEIKKREDLNEFAVQVANNTNQNQLQEPQKQFNGVLIRRPQEENGQRQEMSGKNQQQQQQQEEYKSTPNDDTITDKETQRELEIKAKKRNSNRILHERNIYVFLASVAEEAMTNVQRTNFDIVGFLLVKKLLQMIERLKVSLIEKNNVFNLDMWAQFIQTKDFKDIQNYIYKEYDVFKVYFDSVHDKIVSSLKVRSQGLDEQIRAAINSNYKQDIDQILGRVLLDYCRELVGSITLQKQIDKELLRTQLTHADRIIDCIRMNQTFIFEDAQRVQFNFKQYYEEDSKMDILDLQKKVLIKLDAQK